MGRLLALYLLFWGIGLVLDPRLQDYKLVAFIGLILIGGAWMFLEYDIRYPWEFDDYALKEYVFKSKSSLAILLIFLALAAAIVLAGYLFFNPFAEATP